MDGVRHLFLKEKTSNLHPLMCFIYPVLKSLQSPSRWQFLSIELTRNFVQIFLYSYLKHKRNFLTNPIHNSHFFPFISFHLSSSFPCFWVSPGNFTFHHFIISSSLCFSVPNSEGLHSQTHLSENVSLSIVSDSL